MTTLMRSFYSGIRGVAGLLLAVVCWPAQAALLPPGHTLYDVTFGNGTFVAVGANGAIFSSVKGGEWTLRNSSVTNELRAVAFGGGIFVAAGENGVLVSSPDGETWSVRSVTAVLASPDIAHGNGRFVVGGKGPKSLWTILTSTNGANWESVGVDAPVTPLAPDGLPFAGVSFGAGRFLAVGGTYGGNQTVMSTNGLEWKEYGNEGSGNRGIIGPVTYGNGRFTTVTEWYDDDDDDGGVRHSVASSDQGTRWDHLPSVLPYGRHALLSAECATIVASTYSWYPGFPSIVSFTYDDLSWTSLPGLTSQINAMAFGNGLFVGVGNDIVPLAISRPGEPFAIQPTSYSITPGSYFYFLAGRPCLDPPVHYQWRLNGVNLPGATNLSYSSYNGPLEAAGAYTLVASNASGSLTSMTATVTVTFPPPAAPSFHSPIAETTNGGILGQDFGFSVGFDGSPLPTFQWQFNGTDIPGATNSYLALFNIGPNAVGRYTVRASNNLGTALSPGQSLEIVPAPPPTDDYYESNFSATEGTRASLPFQLYYATAPVSYSILKDGVDTGWPLCGYPVLTLREVKSTDAGKYTLVTTSPSGALTNHVINFAVTPAGPLDHWSQVNPLPQGDNLMQVTYGNGRFIAVGARGAIVSSFNGTDWTSQRLTTEPELYGVAHDGGRWLTFGQITLLGSSDASNWQAVMNRSDLLLRGAAAGNSRIVVVGDQNVLTYSDGLGWREAQLPSTANRQLFDVAFGNGRWVAVGHSFLGRYQAVWTSTDGLQWTPVPGVAADFESVIYEGGQFLAVGDEGRIYTSIDGLSWIRRNSPVSNRLAGAAYGNGRYVAVGTRGRILSSPSAATWSTENSGTQDRLESVTFGNGLFVAVGENGITLTSPNGTSWTRRSRGSTRDLDAIALANGLLTVAGKGGTVLTSSDGLSFVERATGSTNDLHGIGWGNGLHVAVGEPGIILTSPDAVAWTARPTGSGSSLKSVAWGNGRWVTVGTQGEILTSTDGAAWTPRFSPTANDLNGVAHGHGRFVAVGDNLPPNGTLLTSTDGLTWTRRNQYIGKNLRSVTFANGIFFATANDGVILMSDDGENWEQLFTGYFDFGFRNLRSVAHANGTWVLAGNEGMILTSTDTQNWTRRIPPVTENLHGIVYFNGRFVTIGNRGIALASDYFARPALLSATTVPEGVSLSLTGEPGISYRVQAAESLPASQWLNVAAFTLSQPTTNFLTTPAIGSKRFFRAVTP